MNALIWNYLAITLVILALQIDQGAVIRRDWWRIIADAWSASIWPLTVACALWRKYRWA